MENERKGEVVQKVRLCNTHIILYHTSEVKLCNTHIILYHTSEVKLCNTHIILYHTSEVKLCNTHIILYHTPEVKLCNTHIIFRDVARKKYRAVDAYSRVYSSKPSAKQGSLPMKNLKTIIILLHC